MPRSLLEQLPDIVEHPAFQSFYDDLKSEGLLGVGQQENAML
jgi:chemotaxis methyl-accepting protein methylase